MFKNIIDDYNFAKKEKQRNKLLIKHKDHFNNLESFLDSISKLKTLNLNDFVKRINNLKIRRDLLLDIEDLNIKKNILKSFVFDYMNNQLEFLLIDNSDLLSQEDIEEIEVYAKNINYKAEIKYSLFNGINDLYSSSFVIKIEDKKEYVSNILNSLIKPIIPSKEVKILITDLLSFKNNSIENDFYNFIRENRKKHFTLIGFYDYKNIINNEFDFVLDIIGSRFSHIRKAFKTSKYDVNKLLEIIKNSRYEKIRKLENHIMINFKNELCKNEIFHEMNEECIYKAQYLVDNMKYNCDFLLDTLVTDLDYELYGNKDDQYYRDLIQIEI